MPNNGIYAKDIRTRIEKACSAFNRRYMVVQ